MIIICGPQASQHVSTYHVIKLIPLFMYDYSAKVFYFYVASNQCLFFFLIVSVSRSKKIEERSRGHLLKSRDKQQDMQKKRPLELGSWGKAGKALALWGGASWSWQTAFKQRDCFENERTVLDLRAEQVTYTRESFWSPVSFLSWNALGFPAARRDGPVRRMGHRRQDCT